MLSLGNYGIGFDWGIPDEAVEWLARDFTPTGESLAVDLVTVRYLLDTTFAGGTEFGLVTFDQQLNLSGLQLTLSAQVLADQGPEYVVKRLGCYQRFHREVEKLGPVAPYEHAMLDVCVSTFTELARQCADKVSELPPPRYRARSAIEFV